MSIKIVKQLKISKLILILITFVCFFNYQSFSQDAPQYDPAVLSTGSKLFKANCTQCHAINKVVIGPALKDVEKRQSKEWLHKWIKNSQAVIQSGDEYAVNIFNEYKKTAMPAYPFSNEDIDAILAYIDVESSKKEEVVVATADASALNNQQNTGESFYFIAILTVLVVVLVLILVVLNLIVNILKQNIESNKDKYNEADIEITKSKFNISKLLSSNFVVGSVTFVFTAVILKTLIDGAFTIGVQQNYQPAQPIAFSHKLHAGQFEIDCNYCHTGVRKAKSANIPSPNICMNCHSSIQNLEGKEGISPEIMKIYKAIDYNPETGEYGDNIQPIEWVRIHNLPDLAYFNHSQHVEVGGLECQTCHGPIQEMEVVAQYANLTMGWCINCHRETDVKSKDNNYYDKLVELHNEKSKKPMKVEDIGGLECSKCHY